jgi:hypothetical protein
VVLLAEQQHAGLHVSGCAIRHSAMPRQIWGATPTGDDAGSTIEMRKPVKLDVDVSAPE